MKKNISFPVTLLAVAIFAGCSSVPPKNSALTEAHNHYNSALSNPQTMNLAAVELKDASDALAKADAASSKGEGSATVNQLAYIANQKVGVAQETAKRKSAELAVTNAAAKRDQMRLEARTAEADAAKKQVAIVQKTADAQAEDLAAADAELAAADANAERDQALIVQQEKQIKELNAKKTDRGLVITLGDVLFATNKSELAPGGARNVQKLADFLRQYPKHRVLIEGHTDNTGSDSHNRELSERRANAVRMALLDKGISSDRVSTHGYGEEFPVASNDTASSRQMNRRVEVILSDENGNIAPR